MRQSAYSACDSRVQVWRAAYCVAQARFVKAAARGLKGKVVALHARFRTKFQLKMVGVSGCMCGREETKQRDDARANKRLSR